jgi:putative lipoic acid-binding regulatory protein
MSAEIMQFPCDLPIKIFGRNEEDFPGAAYEIVKAHVATLEPGHITKQSSRQGRFVSLTINIRAESRAQVDAVYEDLTANASVLMVL